MKPERLQSGRGGVADGWRSWSAVVAACGELVSSATGAEDPPLFANLSFEQLSRIEITTASKRAEALAETPAAVHVLTGEEIRRLGATTLPDALRYVPGVDVAMINSSQWAVAARGFNGQYANQLLVMMDGRSIYNPAFGGVIWGAQDTFFEDIDRIEIVRGPGGALWGANAVNGVINILTKSAKETQGTVVAAGGGSFYEALAAVRHGFKISENTFGRVYAKYDQFGEAPLATGGDTPDAWNRLQGGFRMDSLPGDASTFTLQGDVHRVDQRFNYPFPSFTPPYSSTEIYDVTDTGANLLGRWTRHLSSDSVVTVQAYYDFYEQEGPVLHQRLHTLDFDVQHNAEVGERHAIAWGAGYRATWDTILPSRVMRVPGREQANDQLVGVFAQDEMALVLEKVFFTLGTKVEHNDYTGWEFQPSGRLSWHPTERQTVWGAVSRAVATPNHLSSGVVYDLSVMPPGALVQVRGGADRVEELLAYEVGHRIQPVERVSVDVAVFYNDYDHLLVAEEPGALIPGAPPVVPVYWVNSVSGHTCGAELALGWQPMDAWRLQGSYTWLEMNVDGASVGRGDEGSSPRHKFGIRSTVDLGRHWEWDTGLRYVSELEVGEVRVPAYVELDLRLAWKPSAHWEVAVVGQNLLEGAHFEYPRGTNPVTSEVPRSVYGRVSWRF